jgi:hypothetical protein
MSDDNEFDEEHALDMVLNDMIKKLQTVRVRFPNESDYIVLNGFQLNHFESIEEYDKDIYGKYKGQYMMVNKEDYNTVI